MKDAIGPGHHTKPKIHPRPIQDFWELSNRILEYSNRGVLRVEFQEEVCRMILEFSGCPEVELWLREHGKYHRCIAAAEDGIPICRGILAYPCDKNGELIHKGPELPALVELGERVILGRLDFAPALVTPRGSLWTGNTACLPRRIRSAWGSPQVTFYSFAIIPVGGGSQNIGLLILKSDAAEFFSREEIDFYEDLSKTLAISIGHRYAQVELRKRVKELTCLYGLARLMAEPGITLEEILKKTVELLPPAWLYPEISSARIVLDGRTYQSMGIREEVSRQRADILENGVHRGSVEILYAETRPELDEGPFLLEERHLLDTVAKELGKVLREKEIEKEQLKLQEQLRHADRLATIGKLAAGVAHEINEPLGNILGFAGLCRKCPGLPPQAERDLEKITTAALQAREIIRKMLLFARRMPPQKTRVNLNQLIQEGLQLFEARCPKEGIEIRRFLSPHLPEVFADPAQLNQVLVNLVVNALQAMPKGGTLTIETSTQKSSVLLTVKDTGQGISPEHREKIFTPFFTTKEIGQGTGLGLSVVHGIVSAHGGTIQIESEPGKGTCFQIRLPMKKNGEGLFKE